MDPIILGIAYGAGLLSFFSPCAFPLLPGYLSYYVGQDSPGTDSLSLRLRLGLLAAAGVFTILGIISVIIWATGSALPDDLIHGFQGVVGGSLLALGIVRIASDRLSLSPPVRAPRFVGHLSFYLFGSAYALVSLCCALPLFLLVVVEALSVGGAVEGALVVLIYSAGLGTLMLFFALGTSAFRGYISSRFKDLMPHVRLMSGALIIAAGSYMVYSFLVPC